MTDPTPPTTTWMLAFDASCCTCSKVSTVVADACGDRITTVPLERADVVELRVRALGAGAPAVPTLLGVDGDEVRAFTGARLAGRLCRVLGARRGLKVLRELGLATRPAESGAAAQEARPLSRKGFVQLASGAAVAGGIVLFGKAPAAVATSRDRAVATWVASNRGSLPTAYDDVVALPLDYRKATYAELAPAQRRRLWLEQLDRFERQMAPLDAAQQEAIDASRAFLGSSHAGRVPAGSPAPAAAATPARAAADKMRAAFGTNHARRAIAELGASPMLDPRAPRTTSLGCECSISDDWCFKNCNIVYNCAEQPSGCGTWYQEPCSGNCF